MKIEIPVTGGKVSFDVNNVQFLADVVKPPVEVPTEEQPTETPPVSGIPITPQNMTKTGNIWRSTGDPLNCYLQWRSAKPYKWVRIRVKRKTNVLPDLSNGKKSEMNLKIARDDRNAQGVKPNTYVGIGVGQGAWKQTTEHPAKDPTNDGQWPSLPYVKDKWVEETWEFDYEKGKFSHNVGGRAWSGSFETGGMTRTDVGVQCVVAGGQRGGVPSNPYTEFEVLGFECRA